MSGKGKAKAVAEKSPHKRKEVDESKEVEAQKKSKKNTECKEEPKQKKELSLSRDLLVHLVTTRCEDFQAPNELFTIKFTDKICDVWGKLIAQHYSSAPVVTEDGFLENFVDLVDIAQYLNDKFGRSMLEGGPTTLTKMTADMKKELKTWMSNTVRDVHLHRVREFGHPAATMHHPNSMIVFKGSKLVSVVEKMAQGNGVHRVAVVESNDNSKLVNLITQTQVLDYIFEQLPHLGAKKYKKIEECYGVKKAIFAVTPQDLVWHAFEHMLKERVTSVAVVNSAGGKLVDCLTISDLYALGTDCHDLHLFYNDVSTFLKRVSELKAKQMEDEEPPSPGGTAPVKYTIPICHGSDTIHKAVKQMHKMKQGRMFLVDGEGIPTGVLSIQDLLAELLSAA